MISIRLLVNSEYKVASDELNVQIKELNKILHKYDKGGMLIGEGPLTADLIDITDTDFKTVSVVSIGIIFVIILILFKSISLPIILVGVIEFAIFCKYGNSILYRNEVAIRCIDCYRHDPAWIYRRLCDPYDDKI